MLIEHTENEDNLELQIIKLTFFIVSYVAILNISIKTSLLQTTPRFFWESWKLDIDIRSVLVLVITSWIDCLELSSKNTYYYGLISVLKEKRNTRNIFGGILGIILVPICFILLFASANGVDITIFTRIVMAASLSFIAIKALTIIEIVNFKSKRKSGV